MPISTSAHNTGDLNFLKRLNRSAILEILRRTPGMTRADLAVKAGLTKATVGASVQTLLDKEWLVEGDLQKSGGGRPGRMLYLNDDSHVLVGTEVGVHGLRLVACSLSGKLVARHYEPLVPTTPEDTAARLAEQIQALIGRPEVARREQLGLGVALPGPTSSEQALLRLAPNLGWHDVKFLDLLRTHLPELGGAWLMDNEANAGAFGELYFRTGNIPQSLVYLSASTGIGSGMVEGRHLPRIIRGVHGLAGEIGHTIVQPGGLYCHCGNRGCAETLVSGWAIRGALGVPEERDLAEALHERRDAADVQVTLQRAGEALGTLLLNLHHTLNPAEIVIGGSLIELGADLLDPALAFFESNQNRLLGRTGHVVPRVVEDSTYVPARGAAAQVLANTIHGEGELP
jgi:predicted NBD/HSP70 family sugar kinase